MSRCRIGFVGAGGVAARHATVLAALPVAEVLAVTDLDAARRDAFAADHGLRAAFDVAALLELGLDAVYVCVPPFAHGDLELQLAAAGVAVFVEKPVAIDVPTAERVAAALAGTVTGVGLHWRHSAAVARARELLDGRPARLVSAAWLDKVPPVPWWAVRARSGGQVVEQAVHVLDVARVLVGEVSQVAALGDGAPPDVPGADVDSATVAALRFETGAVGTLAATSRLGWKQRAGLELVADGLVLSVAEDGLEARTADGVEHLPVDIAEAKAAVDRAFVQAVLGDPSGVLVDYGEALRTHRVACAIARSAAEGGTAVDPRG